MVQLIPFDPAQPARPSPLSSLHIARALPLVRIVLGLCCVTPLSAWCYDDQHPETLPVSETGPSGSASVLYDSNVTRTDSDGLSDESLQLSVGDGLVVPLTPYLETVFSATGSLEQFDHWVGLSHADMSGDARIEYRPSAAFYAPTLALSEKLSGSAYRVGLRSGFGSVTSISISEALNDRFSAFVALSHSERRAENSTFDGRFDAARVHLDYQASAATTLYSTLEHRYGDSTTTSFPDPDNKALALARTPDAAFGDTGRISYRFKASTQLATIGINHSLSEQRSIDFSWRRATVKPARALGYFGATQAKYVDDQISLSYLIRF
jgi:hypothetical protein